MKRTLPFISVLSFMLLFASGLIAQKAALHRICPAPTGQTKPADTRAIWDVLLYFETTASSQSGVVTDGNFIYTSSFSTEMFRKFTMDGTFIEEFTIPGVTACNSLTYDGAKFYGAKGPLDDGIFVLNLEDHLLTNTISINAPSVIGIGHLAYDPDLDGGNGGFWIGYWHELAAVDMNGNEIIPNTVSGLPGIAGTAYDNITDPGNPSLFCFQQTGSSNLEITRYYINSGTFSDVLHVATDIPGPSGGSSNSIASGLNSFINNDGKLVLLGMIDCFPGNEMVFEYEISDAYTYTNDISVHGLISPVTGEDLTGTEDVTVAIYNNGTVSQTGFDIQYTIDDGSGPLGPFIKTVAETIDPDETVLVTFDDQADLSSPGTDYTFVITALLPGDENPANDTLVKVVTNLEGIYCDASGGSTSSQEYIANVQIGDVSNSSSADHYTDYTGDEDLWIYLDPGIGEQLTITLANPYNADIGAVWVDWNSNASFYDPGETVYVSPMGQGPYETTIIAPEDALSNTNLRMRIRLDYNQPDPDPCGTSSFGEVEDYTVIVSGESLYPPENLQYNLTDEDIELSWDAPEGRDLLSYNVYYSLNLGDFELIDNVTETSYAFPIPGDGSHRFYVTAVYDGGESQPSNIVEVLITGIISHNGNSIRIYPNPATDVINVCSNQDIQFIRIFNNTGKLLLHNEPNTGQVQLQVNSLNTGIYLLQISTKSGVYTKKIIVK
jgi:hypothetical protein